MQDLYLCLLALAAICLVIDQGVAVYKRQCATAAVAARAERIAINRAVSKMLARQRKAAA